MSSPATEFGDLGVAGARPALRPVTTDVEIAANAAAQAAHRLRQAAHADSTRETYGRKWKSFATWCTETGHQALPATPDTVADYIGYLYAERGLAASTIDGHRSAISHRHVTHQPPLPDPTDTALVRTTLRGVHVNRATEGRARKTAKAATPDRVQPMVATTLDSAAEDGWWKADLGARRDAAIIVVGYAAAFRGAEIAGLAVDDLSLIDAAGGLREQLLRIRLRGSKTHRTEITHKDVRRGSTGDARWCPWCSLARWLVVLAAYDQAASTRAGAIAVHERLAAEAGDDPAVHRCEGSWLSYQSTLPLFRSLAGGGYPSRARPLTERSIRRIVAGRGVGAGFAGLSGHSLRAGATTHMFDKKTPVEDVMALTGHARMETALIYDRHRDQRSAQDVGL